ncbi:MAG TPA: hypothetical protein PKO15_17090 [Fibrobacteria bacterium]|nr:hypothetical protein [Fibrobacteria bacterium]
MNSSAVLGSVAALLVMSCGDSRQAGGMGAGNPEPIKIGVVLSATPKQGHMPSPSAARIHSGVVDTLLLMRDSSGIEFQIHRMYASIDHIEIDIPTDRMCPENAEGDRDCQNGIMALDTAVAFDLLSYPPSQGIWFILPQGKYSEVKIRLSPWLQGKVGTEPDALTGNSVLVEGIMSRLGVNRPFRLALRSSHTLEFKDTVGLDIGAMKLLKARVNPHSWMDGVNVGRCLDAGLIPSGTDTLLLDSSYPCGNIDTPWLEDLTESTSLEEEN